MNTSTKPRTSAATATFGQPEGFAAGKGLALILLALVIGVLLLTQGLGDGDSGQPLATTETTVPTTQAAVADTSTDGTAASVVTTVTTVPVPTTVAPVPSRTTAETAVVVANGNGGKGVAGDASQVLIRLGYNALRPVDTVRRPATIVYFLPTWEAEAKGVAQSLGIPTDRVQPSPADPGVQLGTATVLVILGQDDVGLQPG